MNVDLPAAQRVKMNKREKLRKQKDINDSLQNCGIGILES